MRVREIMLSDYTQVMAVRNRNGMGTEPKADWEHFWTRNPFRCADMPMGWLLEDADGHAVGIFLNVPVGYEWNGHPLRAVAASVWVVDPDHRGSSLMLAARFFAQKNVDLFLNTTANHEAGLVFEAFKGQRVPHPTYDRALFWITGYRRFAASVLRKKHVPGTVIFWPALALGLWGLDIVRLRRRHHNVGQRVRRLSDFDERFDTLWDRQRHRTDQLLPVRSREALAWHFHAGLRRGQATILAVESAGRLAGYAVLIRRDREDIGLTRLLVGDLQLADDSTQTVLDLLHAALQVGREQGVAMLEVHGFSGTTRTVLAASAPHRRQLPNWPFYFKARSADLHESLCAASAWCPCPFDGDASF